MGRGGRIMAMAGLSAVAALVWLSGSPARADCPVDPTVVPGCEVPPPPTLPTTTTTQPPPPPAPRPDAEAVARRLLELVNQERTSRGLPALVRRADVDTIALAHGRTMAARLDIWHNDGFFTKAVKDRLGATLLGENVAMNNSVDDMHRRLMASPHHRENILDRRYSQIGIGVGVADNGWLFATEDFVQPRVVAAAAAPKAPAVIRPTTTAPPTTAAAPPVAAEPSELALPGPMAMAGADVDAVELPATGGGAAVPFAAVSLLALAALACVARYAALARASR